MSSMEDIKNALTCNICLDICNYPVHPNCCEKTKSARPGCLSCVRSYYQFNKDKNIKSWTGCGCTIKITDTSSENIEKLYKDIPELDIIRNLVGSSKCYLCNLSFETVGELRRHLNNKVETPNKYNNCLGKLIQCRLCNKELSCKEFFGKHFIENHTDIECDICNQIISKDNFTEHYDKHSKDMIKLYKKIESMEKKIVCANRFVNA